MGNEDDMGRVEEGIAGDPTSHTSVAKDDENDDDVDTQPQHKPLWRQKHCLCASLLLLLAIVGGAVGIVTGIGKKDASSSATDTNEVATMSTSNNTDAPTLAPVAQYLDGEQIDRNTFNPTLAPNVDQEINYDGIPTYTTTSTTQVSGEETSMKPATNAPSTNPTPSPSDHRLPVTAEPTPNPRTLPVTDSPSQKPTDLPMTNEPSINPSKNPIMPVQSENPTKRPTTSSPSQKPTDLPVTADPTLNPTKKPITNGPTKQPGSEESSILMPVLVDQTCYYNKKQDVYVSAEMNFVSQEMFGGAAQFDGNTALVTQYREQSLAWGAGAVWILSKVNGIWEVTTALQSSETEQFGWALSIEGDDMIAIGSPGYDGKTTFDSFLNTYWYGRGRVNVLQKDGGAWLQEATLLPADADEKAEFGVSLDIADCKCLIAVGAWNDRDTRGSTYIYSRLSNGSWAEIQKLAPISTSRSESFTYQGNFGHSVAFSKNAEFLAVKAPYDYLDGQRGVVYMYRGKTNANGSQQYDEFDRLSTPEGLDISYTGLHGSNVVFLDGHLLVGSPGYGKVYVFTQNGLGLYRKSAELTASNYGAESLFGLTIDGDGTQAIIGSQYYSLFDGEQYLSYLFSLEGNSWVEKAKFDGGASLSGNAIMHVNNNFGVDFSMWSYGGDVSFYDLECER